LHTRRNVCIAASLGHSKTADRASCIGSACCSVLRALTGMLLSSLLLVIRRPGSADYRLIVNS
jgi:hypothetical protein